MSRQNIPDIPYLFNRIYQLENIIANLAGGNIDILSDNTLMPKRARLGFTGIGKRVTDNPLNDSTDIDISSPAIIGKVVMDAVGAPFSVVTVDGKIANSANVAHAGRVAGVAVDAPAVAVAVDIVFYGEVENPAWSFTEGDLIFLNGTSLSSTPPSSGFVQLIGSAVSPTKIIVRLDDAILL